MYSGILAEGSHKMEEFLSELSLIPLVDFQFALPSLEVSYEHFPREIHQHLPIVGVYEVAPLR